MLDIGLALVLILGLPMLTIWREISGVRRSRVVRYRSAILTIAGCLIALAVQWTKSRRGAADLGLNLPPTGIGWCCLAAATVLLILAGVALRRRPPSAATKDDDDPFPRTLDERRAFILFALMAGMGWELLYRGFLLWFLSPRLGVVLAVGVAASSYGAAHGLRDRRQATGSIVSAFLFTIAYALTHDLWWLMLIHVGLPMMALASSRSADAAAG